MPIARGRRRQRANQRGLAVDGDGQRRAPRQRFEGQHAGAGVELERRRAGEVLAQPVEQRLPDAVRRRAQAPCPRNGNAPAAVAAADDANAVGCGHGKNGTGSETVEFQFTCAPAGRLPGAVARLPMFDLFKRKPAAEPATDAGDPPGEARRWCERLKAGLGLSRDKLSGAVAGVFRRRVLDDQALDELESALLMADVGVEATEHLLAELRSAIAAPAATPILARCCARRSPISSARSKRRFGLGARGRSSSCWPASTAPARRRRSASSPNGCSSGT